MVRPVWLAPPTDDAGARSIWSMEINAPVLGLYGDADAGIPTTLSPKWKRR